MNEILSYKKQLKGVRFGTKKGGRRGKVKLMNIIDEEMAKMAD